jgi:hypothetical protein
LPSKWEFGAEYRPRVHFTPATIWIVYTLMFGYPVATRGDPEFTNQTACEIYKHSLGEQAVNTFKIVCSKK